MAHNKRKRPKHRRSSCLLCKPHTQGFEAAYAQARETAGEDGIDIAGGASTVRQALAAGVIDELTLDVAPVLFGSGERLFDGVESLGFEPVEVLHSPLATHIRYRRAG
jgi:dihydrofolate reductase